MGAKFNSHIIISAAAGIAFGASIIAWPWYVTNDERQREISFLRTEYFAARDLAQIASKTAEHSVDIAEAYSKMVYAMQIERAIERLTVYIHRVNPKVPAQQIAKGIVLSAEKHGLDRRWWAAQVEEESHFNPYAISKAGAHGLSQIMPRTAPEIGLDWKHRFSIENNLDAGALYMKRLIEAQGSFHRALLRYEGGSPEYPQRINKRYARLPIL